MHATAALAAPSASSVLMLMLSLHVHGLTQEKTGAQGVTHVDFCMPWGPSLVVQEVMQGHLALRYP